MRYWVSLKVVSEWSVETGWRSRAAEWTRGCSALSLQPLRLRLHLRHCGRMNGSIYAHLTFIHSTDTEAVSPELQEMLKCLKIPLPKKRRSRGFRRQREKEGKEEIELHGSRILTTLPALTFSTADSFNPGHLDLPIFKRGIIPQLRSS